MAGAATLRRRLVRELEGKGLLRDKRVRAAFLAVPREHFVPEVGLEDAYRDIAIVTKQTDSGLGLSSSSQPGIMAEMLEELRLEPDHRVLEIGAGTGYNAALLQHIVGKGGRVVTVDIDPETATRARRALKGLPVKVVTGDGRDGHLRGAPYDRIIVTASAAEVPAAWHTQLVEGGLLELPLTMRGSAGFQLIPTFRRERDQLRSITITCGGFMPIRHDAEELPEFPPMINVNWTRGSEAVQLITIAGPFVSRARQLVATAFSQPRSVRLSVRASAKALEVYLSLQGPARRLVHVLDESSYRGGIATRNGRSLALLAGYPTVSRMLVYGGDEAAEELEQLVADWVERGRPSERDVELVVSFHNGRSAVRTRWRGR